MNIDQTEENINNTSSLPPLDTQSLSSNEDATERTPSPYLSERSKKNTRSRVEEVNSDNEDEDSDEGSDSFEGSDYETDSTGSSTSVIDISEQPMYTILSAFLESADLENRINVTEAIIDLKSSVDRVADMLEKLVNKTS
jgi:hypothetical protein